MHLRPLLLVLMATLSAAAQETPDPCEPLLAASHVLPAWPGIVIDVISGDTILVQLRDIGRRRIRLAGLRAPSGADPLATVSRFHLTRLAKGLRVFVVLDPPWKTWPEDVVAPVEDFTEAQLAAGMGGYVAEEGNLLGEYLSCRCRRAEADAREAKSGIWGR
jgi:endonuclease YncB( thermonuclease family)